MTTSFDPSGKGAADKRKSELKGVDRLFGRDLRSKGWFVDPSDGGSAGPESRHNLDRGEQAPDPAMIWALRWRRR